MLFFLSLFFNSWKSVIEEIIPKSSDTTSISFEEAIRNHLEDSTLNAIQYLNYTTVLKSFDTINDFSKVDGCYLLPVFFIPSKEGFISMIKEIQSLNLITKSIDSIVAIEKKNPRLHFRGMIYKMNYSKNEDNGLYELSPGLSDADRDLNQFLTVEKANSFYAQISSKGYGIIDYVDDDWNVIKYVAFNGASDEFIENFYTKKNILPLIFRIDFDR